jgi:hypothetical protein
VNAATEAHTGENPATTGDNNATEPVNTGVAEWSRLQEPLAIESDTERIEDGIMNSPTDVDHPTATPVGGEEQAEVRKMSDPHFA